MRRIRLRSVRSLLFAFSWIGASLHAASLAEPTSENARAAATLAGTPSALSTDWRAQQAPGSEAPAAGDARRVWTVLEGWKKIPLAHDTGAPLVPTDVRVPDDWGYARDRAYAMAWHIVTLDLGAALPPRLWLRFDAVAHRAEIFMNGRRVGGHVGGFTPFEFDVGGFVQPGVNTLAVWVQDETAVVSLRDRVAVSQVALSRPGEWLSPAGIRGGVFLEARQSAHVEHVVVRPSTRQNILQLDTKVRLDGAADATISHAVYEWPAGAAPVLSVPETKLATNGVARTRVAWPDAKRWSPAHPHLYTLRTTIRSGGRSETLETRFGFREFWIEGKNFILNGQPIRLLGSSVAREMEWALTPDVSRRSGRVGLEFLKREMNFTAIRYHNTMMSREAALAADEAGVLVVNQTGLWSAMREFYTNGADRLLQHMSAQIDEWYFRDVNSPSVVIWDVENEMLRDERSPERERWVLALDAMLKRHDPALVVQHSGDAWFSPDQEIVHLHMQERYAEPLRHWVEHGKTPLVFGEFWVGGRGGETRLANSREYASRAEWFQEEVNLYREAMLEMRYHQASGVMPFWLDRTMLSRTHKGIRRTFDPADPVFTWAVPGIKNRGADGLAPAIAIVWPRNGSVRAGEALERTVAVCNDFETTKTFHVVAQLGSAREAWDVTLGPAQQDRHALRFAAPTSGELIVTLTDSDGRAHPGDSLAVHVIDAAPAAAPRRAVWLLAGTDQWSAALRSAGIEPRLASALPEDAASALVIVAPDAPRDLLGRTPDAVQRFLARGGRLLVLTQHDTPLWMPAGLPLWSSAKKSAPEFTALAWPEYTRHLIFAREVPLYAPGHPVLAGLSPTDFTNWHPGDGRVSDDSFVRPSAFALPASAPYRVLAGCTRRENGTLIETRLGAGTALFCQLQVLENLAHPAARRLLANLLAYLDGAAWETRPRELRYAGSLTSAALGALTGLPSERFRPADASTAPDALVLVGDGADAQQLEQLADRGATVVVLSTETAGRLPGYATRRDPSLCYFGTRATADDDPLFWGVASASFAPLADSPAQGALAQFPARARIVLGGLVLPRTRLPRESSSGERGLELADRGQPIAVAETRGAGQLVVTTLEPSRADTPAHRQLLATLLANAGIDLPAATARPSFVMVRKTVPLRLDGRLDDWTNDMEDSAVSLFRHADPIALTSKDVVRGRVADDLEFSGVIYLLRGEHELYVGGLILTAAGAPSVEIDLGARALRLDLARAAASLDGRSLAARFAQGTQPAREVGDTRLLSLLRRNPQIGSLHVASDTHGATFEAAIPLVDLDLAAVPAELPARFRLVRDDGTTLQQPIPDSGAPTTLTLRFER